jgi:hypothetical protein
MKITTPSNTTWIGADNESMLTRLKRLQQMDINEWTSKMYRYLDIDIYLELKKWWTVDPSMKTATFNWIEGHTDTKYPNRAQTWEEKLNTRADELAGIAMNELPQHNTFIPYPACNLYIENQGKIITSWEIRNLRWNSPKQEYKTFIMHTHKWNNETYNMIAHEELESAATKLQAAKTFIIKLTTNWLPTNKMGHTCHSSTPSCRLCNEIENWDHIPRCPNRDEWKENFLRTISDHLIKYQTKPAIQKTILRVSVSDKTTNKRYHRIQPRRNRMEQNSTGICIKIFRRGTTTVSQSTKTNTEIHQSRK